MHEDSIQKASSVEVAERRKGSFLRPITTRGDSFLDERDGSRKLDETSRSGLGLTKLSSGRIPLSRGSSYQPDWAQDADDMPAPPVPVQELGSPEDLKDMLRMGRTQEMRVSLNLVAYSQRHGADLSWSESVQTVFSDIFRVPVSFSTMRTAHELIVLHQVAMHMAIHLTVSRS
jgi:hypothetical protein